MVLGAILCYRTLLLWRRAYWRLTPVIQSYVLVFIPDCVTVATYLPRSIYALAVGALYTGECAYLLTATAGVGVGVL